MTNQTLPPATAPTPKSAAPGSTDKTANSKLTIGIFVLVAIVFIIPLFFMFWPEYQRDQLLKNGVPAQAEIVSLDPTGSWYNNQPQVDVHLRVTPEAGEPFEATATMIINPVYMPQFQPGKMVQVRYDAEDQTNVAIEETEDGTR
jgi:hypothetical protein